MRREMVTLICSVLGVLSVLGLLGQAGAIPDQQIQSQSGSMESTGVRIGEHILVQQG